MAAPTKKNLEEVATSYEDMRKEQQRKRALKESGMDEDDSDVTKVKKGFNKKLQLDK